MFSVAAARLGAERGVGDQHVDPAKPGIDRFEHELDILPQAGVGGQAAFLADARIDHQLFERQRFACERQELGALLGERRESGAPDPGRAAGQQYAFTFNSLMGRLVHRHALTARAREVALIRPFRRMRGTTRRQRNLYSTNV
jgi:hypothetical protein